MKNQFITTENVNRFNEVCKELEDPMSLIGPSLAMVTGPAGRGKSEAATRFAANNGAVYIPPYQNMTHFMLLREISFELAKQKPGRSTACLECIADEMVCF